MFVVLLIGVVGVILAVFMARGPRVAVAVGWAAVLMLPNWMGRAIPGLYLDFGTAVGALLIACCVGLRSGKPLRIRFAVLDLLVLAYTATLITALTLQEDVRIYNLVSQPCEWLLPYVFGRLAYETIKDDRRLTAATALAIVVLSLWGVVEATTRVNPVNYLAGHPWDPMVRMGLARALGPTAQPIYFGLLQVLLIPWALEAAHRAKEGDGPKWWRYLPWISVVGILTSMSRGPAIAALLTFAGTSFVCNRRRRVPLFLLGMLACIGLWVGGSHTIDYLHSLSGENQGETVYVIIDGQPIPYSGTKHRLLLFDVYKDAMRDAGWFGYGRLEDLDRLLPNSSGMRFFESVDNQYIFIVLTAGYMGLGTFLAMGLTTVGYLGSRNIRTSPGVLRKSTCVALGAVLLLMLTVWFEQGFAYVWLFSAGLVASWRTSPPATDEPARESPTDRLVDHRGPTRRLVPGHFLEPRRPGDSGWQPDGQPELPSNDHRLRLPSSPDRTKPTP